MPEPPSRRPLRDSLAANTLMAYATVWHLFAQFAVRHGVSALVDHCMCIRSVRMS